MDKLPETAVVSELRRRKKEDRATEVERLKGAKVAHVQAQADAVPAAEATAKARVEATKAAMAAARERSRAKLREARMPIPRDLQPTPAETMLRGGPRGVAETGLRAVATGDKLAEEIAEIRESFDEPEDANEPVDDAMLAADIDPDDHEELEA